VSVCALNVGRNVTNKYTVNTQVFRVMSFSLYGSSFTLNVTGAILFHRCVCV